MKTKGIPYSDDVACLRALKKSHKRGYRNIYSVRISYVRPDAEGHSLKRKEYRMDYGRYKLAHDRYNIETSFHCQGPKEWSLDEIKIVIMTYKGTKLVNEDVMQTVRFGTQKSYGYDWVVDRNRLGEWTCYEEG
jgi:hypothetical protein